MPPENNDLMDLKLDAHRLLLGNKVLEFIKRKESKILLVQDPSGSGKTCTISKILFPKDDIIVVLLSPRHDQIQKEIVDFVYKETGTYIFHLKGRNQEGMCRNREALDQIPDESNINPEIICRDCTYFDAQNCLYHLQFKTLSKKNISFATVHHYLPKPTILDYPMDALIIDEYAVHNITNKVKFTRKNLEALELILDDIADVLREKNYYFLSKKWNYIGLFNDVIDALKHILTLTTSKEKGISGLEFVKLFVERIEKRVVDTQSLRDMEPHFDPFKFEEYLDKNKKSTDENKESIENFIYQEFYPILREKVINGNGKDLKNILSELLEITQTCFKIYNEKIRHDLNLKFFSAMGTEENKFDRYIQYTEVFRDLPDVPIIISDATGDKKFYSNLFNREVEVYKSKINVERKIFQVMSGFYWKGYFKHKDIRNRLFLDIFTIINHHLEKGEKIVNVITYKFLEKELKHYLENKKLGGTKLKVHIIVKKETENKLLDEKINVRIGHFGALRGTNIMKDDNILIILGTPEPNVMSFPLEIGAWYLDEELISNKRIRGSKHKYKDPRYAMHVRMVREHEIEQLIDRLRQIRGDPNKTVYLFSKLPIAFETTKISRKELIDSFILKERLQQIKKLEKLQSDPICVYLSHAEEGDTFSDVYHKTQNIRPFVKNKSLLRRTKDHVIEKEFIKVEGAKIKEITELGKNYMDSTEAEIESLYNTIKAGSF